MKILIIHTHYQLQGGEDAVVVQELELLRRYHDVAVLYFQNQGGWRGAVQFLCSIWNVAAARTVNLKIKEFKPDVVHIHNWHFAAGPIIFREINRLSVPIVHTVHNYRLLCPSAILLYNGQLFSDSLRQSFPWKAIVKKVYRSSMTQTFWIAFIVWVHKKIGTWKKIDSYVCLTPFAVDLFQQSNFGISKQQFFVKPNFTLEQKVFPLIERETHFLFVGRLSEEKGIETLLNAFSDLPFLLKIAGDGPLKELVVKKIKQSSNITYLGNLSNQKVAEELRKAQALIISSICYEGMPMTILESFSSGTPVIASNLGAMTSLISNGFNGLHFEPGSVNNLKEIISAFSFLPKLEKEQMCLNAFETYKSIYSPELQLGYFDAIYNKGIEKQTNEL